MTRPQRRGGLLLADSEIGVHGLIERAQLAEKVGLDALWLTQLPSQRDSAAILAAMAVSTDAIRLGAGILPYYTRPPVVMAQLAATLAELGDDRFALGIGTGHRLMAGWMDPRGAGGQVTAMRDYVTVVTQLLRTGEVHHDGAVYQAHAAYTSPRAPGGPPVLVGAFGPRMCRLAGEHADGLMVWMCTPEYLRDVALPQLHEGLRLAGRHPGTVEVVAAVPGGVTADLEGDRAVLRRYLATYARVPNYRRMYEASGLGDAIESRAVGDELLDGVAALGDPDDVTARVATYHEMGATEVLVAPMGMVHYDPGLMVATAEAVADARC